MKRVQHKNSATRKNSNMKQRQFEKKKQRGTTAI